MGDKLATLPDDILRAEVGDFLRTRMAERWRSLVWARTMRGADREREARREQWAKEWEVRRAGG